MRLYTIIKQALLAFMNGAVPLIALEHGRKTISAYDRPSIDEVEKRGQWAGLLTARRKRRRDDDGDRTCRAAGFVARPVVREGPGLPA